MQYEPPWRVLDNAAMENWFSTFKFELGEKVRELR
jgi:hypothetical protein